MDLGLKNKVTVVTGGSRGLGRAIALALAAEGAHVVVNYRRDEEEAARTVARIEAECRVRTAAIAADVAAEEDVRRLFDQAEELLGPVDVVINNAGVWPTALVRDMTATQWRKTLDVNLTGPFLVCREAVRRWLAAATPGRIVNVSSQAAFRGSTTGHADYASAKAGLVSLTVSLAREVASHGIAVNAVAPGMMETDMARDALESSRDEYLKRIPLGRIGDPAEIAAVVVFLASPAASYMTGATVDVTGGMLMR